MCVADGVRRKFERNRFAAWIAPPKAVVSAVALLSTITTAVSSNAASNGQRGSGGGGKGFLAGFLQ